MVSMLLETGTITTQGNWEYHSKLPQATARSVGM